jgi:hypothetical protein
VVDKKFNCTDLVQGVVEGLILRYQVRSFRGLVGSQGSVELFEQPTSNENERTRRALNAETTNQ